MSKLYIPTTTLNFNNILSSESISPAGFYQRRAFGYQTFSKSELNNFDNSILLYDKLPIYTIKKNDFDDYPMIIEIEKDEFLEELKPIIELDNINIYQTDKTIYLNPFTTKIYFLDPNHKRISYSKSEASAETKLVKLYENQLINFSNQVDTLIFDNKYLDNIIDFKAISSENIAKDKSVDRIKGFAFGYLIGANKSLSKELVQLKKQSRKIADIISSILNSGDSRIMQLQQDQLNTAINSFNICQNNDIVYKINEIGNTKNGKEILDYIFTRLKIAPPLDFDAFKIKFAINDKEKCLNYIEQMMLFVDKNESKFLLKKPLFNWQNISLTSSKLSVLEDTVILEDSRVIYKYLINEVFVSEIFNGKTFSPNRLEIATEVTKKIKSLIEEEGKKWEDHTAKDYLNKLRRNVGGDNVTFEIKWDNGVLPAIASFILKGDEPDKLEDFLIENEIPDFRLAFGFYGALFGFAGLSKVFTNNFFNFGEPSYIIKTYKDIFKQLHNIDINDELNLKNENFIQREVISEEKKPESSTFRTVSEININDINQESERIYFELEKKCKSVKKHKNKYIQYISNFGLSDNLMENIKKDKNLSVPNNVIEFFDKIIKSSIVKTKKAKNAVTPEIFSDNDFILPFYSDVNAWNKIKTIIPKKFQNQFQTDLIWFQDNYKEYYFEKDGKKAEGRYYKLDKSNNEVINKFETYLEYKKNNKTSKTEWLSIIYSQIDIKTIINRLKELYK